MNWKDCRTHKPTRDSGGYYKNVLVFVCNPEYPQGGVFRTLRWDFKNNKWLANELASDWVFEHPYKITHFFEDFKSPFDD